MRARLQSAIVFAILAVGLVVLVAVLRGGEGLTWQSVVGGAAGGFLAGLVAAWVQEDRR